MKNIKRATAVYSGGNIYLYYAELESGNWIMGNDEFLIVVNSNPILDEKTFDESGYYEWQVEHLVEEVPEKQYQDVLNNILEVIFKGKTIEKYNNFLISELEDRYKK